MFEKILVVLVALGGGIVAGGALAAFIALINLIPRLVQMTQTRESIKLYENIFTAGSIVFTITYFGDFNLGLPNIVAIIVALFMGMFIGLFSSALAEVLNVMPVLSKKFKIKNELNYISYALLAGKVFGSLYYWLYY